MAEEQARIFGGQAASTHTLSAAQDDRVYLKARMELCREKARDAQDPGLSRVYRDFAAQYAKVLADKPPSDASHFLLKR